MCFSCIFFCLDWRIDVWGWKSKCFCQKMRKILGWIFFFFFLQNQGMFSWKRRRTDHCWRHHDVIIKKKTIFFLLPWYSWIDYAYVRIIMHLLNLTLLEQLLLLFFLWYNFYFIPIMLSKVNFVNYLNLLWQYITLVWLPITIPSVSNCENWIFYFIHDNCKHMCDCLSWSYMCQIVFVEIFNFPHFLLFYYCDY